MKQTLLIITFLLSGYLQNFAQNYETFVTEMKKLEQEEKEYSGILFRKNDYSAEYKKGFEPKLKKVREEKDTVAPDCAVCAAPCGNTSEYDVSNIWKHETDVRGVETAILFGIREMAAIIYPAVVMGKMDAEVNEFFYKALCMISYGMSKEDLLPVVQELGEMNQKCRELLGQV